MKPGPESVNRLFMPLALMLLLILLPPMAAAQQKKPPAPAPAPKPAPAPHPAPAPAQHLTGGGGNAGKPGEAHAGRPEGAPNSNSRTASGGVSSGNRTNTSGTTNNKTTGSTAGTTRTNTNTNNRSNTTGPTNSRTTPNSTTVRTVAPNPTTIRPVTPNATGGNSGANSRGTANSSAAGGRNAGTTRTNTATGGRAGGAGSTGKVASPSASRVNNQPGTHPLPNGGTRTVRSNGSAVERNKSGKVTGLTTSKGITAKLDAHGHAAAIHDGHGTSISRGPHGERRVETVRGDHSRLVSTGRHSGYDERRFTRGDKSTRGGATTTTGTTTRGSIVRTTTAAMLIMATFLLSTTGRRITAGPITRGRHRRFSRGDGMGRRGTHLTDIISTHTRLIQRPLSG
jgi:hypothetical protein